MTEEKRKPRLLHVATVVNSAGIRILPDRFELAQIDDLVVLIAHMLERLIKHNDTIALTPNSLTRFHSRAPPGISVLDYLSRITKFTNVEPCCLLMLLYYIDRVSEKLPSFTITSLTVHRFVIAAVAAGSKALCDSFCTNGRYAKVGGVSLIEMNILEKELLTVLEWRLTTSGALLTRYYGSLVASHPDYQLSTEPVCIIKSTTVPDTAPSASFAAAADLVPVSNGTYEQDVVQPLEGNGQIDSPLSPNKTAPGSPMAPFAIISDDAG